MGGGGGGLRGLINFYFGKGRGLDSEGIYLRRGACLTEYFFGNYRMVNLDNFS